MIYTLISLTSLILSAYGASRFVIDGLTIPVGLTDSETTQYPFPIDVCVNYLVELDASDISNLRTTAYYGRYTCNEAGDQVTFTDYGAEDDECTAIVTQSSYDKTITAVGTFNCWGEDNYVQVGAYTVAGNKLDPDGGNICCGEADLLPTDTDSYVGIVTTTFATELCLPVPDTDPQEYTLTSCDGDTSGNDFYTDATCETEKGSEPEGTAEAGYCEFFENILVASVYRMQLNCVMNGTVEEPTPISVLPCTPYPSEAPTTPTMKPTMAPTVEPTIAPTMEPTVPTMAPTDEEESEDESKGYTYPHAINYIALLLIGMIIFN